MLSTRVETARRVDWVEDESAFCLLEEAWDELAEPEALPFLRHAWLAAWWRAFGAGGRLRICVVWDGDVLAGVFPLAQRGRSLHALANEHTPVFRPFARDPQALRLVVDAALAAGASSLVAPCLPADDRAVAALAGASRARGRLTLVRHQYRSPYVDTRGDFAGYVGGMNRKSRKELERQRRKLEAEVGARFTVLGAPDDLDAALEPCFELEASGWKGRRGSAIAHSGQALAFYRGVARSFADAGRLRLSTIWGDEGLIAFDYALLDHDRLWILKGGYDERYRRYGPGLLLTLAQIQECCELGLDGLELLGDDAPWKAKFATGAREHCFVRSYRWLPVPLGRYAYWGFVRPRLRKARARLHGR